MANLAELYDSAMKHLVSSRETSDPLIASKRLSMGIKFLCDLREELNKPC